jgi:hypothetical protein
VKEAWGWRFSCENEPHGLHVWVREVPDMSVTEKELETTPIFAALSAEFGLERLIEAIEQSEKGVDQGE